MQTLGFWEGQRVSLQRIAQEFPAHARCASQLGLQLEAKFGSAIEGIHSHGRSLTVEWDSLFDELMAQVQELLTQQVLSEVDVTTFLGELESRLNGELPSPVGETILSFHPKYDRTPALEFTDRLKKEFVSDGSGKSRGLKLAIEFPRSWISKEGRRPHIVQVLKSKAGHGDASVLVQVRGVPADVRSEYLTHGELELLAGPGTLAAELPAALFIDQGTTTVVGKRATWSHYLMTQESAGVKVKMFVWSVHLFYERQYVNLQFFVGRGAVPGQALVTDRELEAQFDSLEPLFKLILSSFDIYNRYDAP